ncbi:MAG: SAM-dependent methyltransferase [Halobacteriovoraceae bacterium]|nr:SAM-dependent methyltransferase [Halobacteriovoraceae bacterium]|tara:strand:- start:152156 stop:152845 length:690 start_codon:yes stop_codon:yes gene_type:complete
MKIALICALLISLSALSKSHFTARRLSQLSGEKNSVGYSTKKAWDKAYSRPSYIFGKAPAKFLAENFDYLPANAKVLDIGMGEGRNAVFLADKGHKVTGIDISSVAVKKSRLLAKEFGVKIKGIVASLDKYKFPKESFDAIICFYYVDKSLLSRMKKWLKPGGVLIYEAYTEKQKTVRNYPKYSDDQYLKSKELLGLFDGLSVLKYEEPLHEKIYRASIILKKPKEAAL